jgi:Haem-degrading
MRFHLNSTATSAVILASALALTAGSGPAAGQGAGCDALSDHAELTAALVAAVAEDNGGLANDMWASIVNWDGIVCAVTFSGDDRGDQWPGSRVISAQKANTANAFSLPQGAGGIDGLALSTANLWTAVQPGGSTFIDGSGPPPGPPSRPFPGGSLFGLQFSNPVNTDVAYLGPAENFGLEAEPMVDGRIGGVNVFGGGLALYEEGGTLLGAVGVSGDTSCADHNVAWRVRDALGLDFVPAGVGTPADNMIFDVVDTGEGNAVSPSGFGHPECDAGAIDANETVIAACPPGDGSTQGCVAAN